MSLSRSIALTATLAAMALATASAADEYQWEISLGYSQNTADEEPEIDSSTIFAHGEFHFAPVKLADHPYEEASFLEHSTFVEAEVGYAKVEAGSLEATGTQVGAGFTFARPDFPLAFSVDLTHAQVEDDDIDVEIKSTTIGADAGIWITPGLIAGLRVAHTKNEIGDSDDKELDLSAFGKWVRGIGDNLAFNAELEIGQRAYDADEEDSNIFVEAIGDLYFRQRFGVGVTLGTESGDADDAEGMQVGLHGSAWINESFGVRVGYDHFAAKDDDFGADDDTVSVELAGRF